MRHDWLMPKLGLTMTEGALVEWTVAPGARFKAGDCVFVVENDKAATEVAAEADGIMGPALVAVGEAVPVGAVLGHWDDAQAPAGDSAAASATAPAAVAQSAPLPAPTAAPAAGALPAAAPRVAAARVPVTPLARRMAHEQGIALAGVKGSGPRGRVRARDIEAALAQRSAAAAPAAAVVATAATVPADQLRAATLAQQTAARRLTAAKQEIPHFYLQREVEVSRLLDLRRQLKGAAAAPRLTLNHFIVAAVGRALRALPELNRVWTAEGILTLGGADVGVAVDTDRGLMVPVLRDAGRLPLAELAVRTGGLVERARAGRLGAAEMAGGAITVSNAGMHDVSAMTSIIVPGQAMILGVGSIRELFRPDERGQPALRREMTLVLSADHRVLDGVSALRVLGAIADGLGNPARLLLA